METQMDTQLVEIAQGCLSAAFDGQRKAPGYTYAGFCTDVHGAGPMLFHPVGDDGDGRIGAKGDTAAGPLEQRLRPVGFAVQAQGSVNSDVLARVAALDLFTRGIAHGNPAEVAFSSASHRRHQRR